MGEDGGNNRLEVSTGDLLGEPVAPVPSPDGQVLHLSLECIAAVAESVLGLTLAAYSVASAPGELQPQTNI